MLLSGNHANTGNEWIVLSSLEMLLLLAGVVLGALLNHFIYALAYFSPAISPWQSRPEGLAKLPVAARVPMVGWLMRMPDRSVFGPYFWVRPLLIEILTPILLVGLYRWVMSGTLMPIGVQSLPPFIMGQFVCYAVLLCLMTVATFIDFDEQTIPDTITIPGTWIGVLGATLVPGWLLTEASRSGSPPFATLATTLHANSPHAWPLEWGQVGWGWSIGMPLFIWCAWCCALGNLRWITRRGIDKAFTYAVVGFFRSPNLGWIVSMMILGSTLILMGYRWLPPERWQALLTSLLGVGLGGCLLWSFRIVASRVLQQEALGFGDVTLMSMVGAFLGWQVVWVAFFLAPLFGVAFVLVHMLVSRDAPIPFGPYLCAATAYLMLDWPRVWDVLSPVFPPVTSSLLLLVGLLVVLGALLWVVHWLKLRMGLGAARIKA